MINSIETNVIDNIIEVRKPVLHHNENDTPCMVQFQSDVMLWIKWLEKFCRFWQEMRSAF